MKPKKDARAIGLRIDADINERLTKLEEATGLEGVGLARRALVAAIEYFEEHGTISFPLQVVAPAKKAKG